MSSPKPLVLDAKSVLLVFNCDTEKLQQLLSKYQLLLKITDSDSEIPGSYWGESEAGLISNTVYVRIDTPIHSLLHEACHYVCMDEQRREKLNTNAEGDYDEENGVCYLQIILAGYLPEIGQQRMMRDMDAWGYTFRLGSAEEWFRNDAEDALAWLQQYKIVDDQGHSNFLLRK